MADRIRRYFVDIPEGQIHYRTAGQGEPLLLLHQGCRSSLMYVDLIPLLADDYRVIAMDLMGYGNSDPYPPNIQIPKCGQYVAHFLDALQIEKCHLFGLHTGACISTEVAAAYPDKIGTLTLFGIPVHEGEGEIGEFYEALAQHGTGVPQYVLADGSHLTQIWARISSEVLRYWMHHAKPPSKEFHPQPFAPAQVWATPQILEFMDRWLIDYSQCRPHLWGMMNILNRYSYSARMPLIKAPTLLIDPDSPYENFFCLRNDVVQKLIPGSTAVTLPDSDDNAAEFRAPQLAEMMLDFLRKHRL